jgi:pimeloyl-ACP methyl ester carboxylesterase
MPSLRLLLPLLCLPLFLQAQFSPAPLPKPLQGYPDAARMKFGYITVPENHSDPGNGRTVRLAVITLPAITPSDADPVFYIVGGPGGQATYSASGVPVFDELNKTRDVVFIDPRGAGFSEANLFMRRNPASISQFTSQNRAFFAKQGIDVTTFNTTQIAEDYESARVALGYTNINLFANSYGTFVAQEWLRRHPANLRAVVMSGNSPATDPFLPTTVKIEEQGINALLQDVSSNPPARRAFPNFRQRFYAMMEKVTKKPLKLTLKNRDNGKMESVILDGREFVGTITEMLQLTRNMRYIPALVREMERKSNGPLLRRFFAPRFETRRDNAFGMYLSVLGTDFAAPGYVDATERGILATKNRALIGAEGPTIYQLAQIIVSWGVPYNPGTTRTLPQSNVRTLFLNGMMDAQTPASGGATIATGVTNSINYVYPRVGHAVGFVNGPDMDAAISFIRNPAQTPPFKIKPLKRRNFYITRGASARFRMVDNWRDLILDPPLSRFLPDSPTGPQ